MRLVDLSHVLTPDMPVYPGDIPPTLTPQGILARDGYNQLRLDLGGHTGTHLDAPAHLLAGGATLDQLAVECFTGLGCVLDLTGITGPWIEPAHLESQAGRLAGAEFALVRTGWDRYWGQPRYLEGFPVLSAEAATWLAARPGLKGVGVDTLSPDPVGGHDLPAHQALLRAGLVVVENLCGLERLPTVGFTFWGLPLAIVGGDGCPVRAVGQVTA